jgi:predicted lipid-binding transport protein (Tim44 family)
MGDVVLLILFFGVMGFVALMLVIGVIARAMGFRRPVDTRRRGRGLYSSTSGSGATPWSDYSGGSSDCGGSSGGGDSGGSSSC